MTDTTDVGNTEDQTFNTLNEQSGPANVNPFAQENLEKSIKEFEVIQSAARKQIEVEVNKVKDYIKNFKQSICDNIKNIQDKAVPGAQNKIAPFDFLKKATENTSDGIEKSLNSTEQSIRGAMETVNKSALLSDKTEQDVTQSMMSVDEAMADLPENESEVSSAKPVVPGIDQTKDEEKQPEQLDVPVISLESPDMNQISEATGQEEESGDTEQILQPQSDYEQDLVKKEADVSSAMEEVLKAQRESEEQLKD